VPSFQAKDILTDSIIA